MKRAILIILLISFTFSYASDSKNPNNIEVVKTIQEFSKININALEIEALDFSVKVTDNIDFINIYKNNKQQIFSNKKGRKHYRNRYVEYVIFTNRNVLC